MGRGCNLSPFNGPGSSCRGFLLRGSFTPTAGERHGPLLPLPLRERAGVRGKRNSKSAKLHRSTLTFTPHPNPLPQGEREDGPCRSELVLESPAFAGTRRFGEVVAGPGKREGESQPGSVVVLLFGLLRLQGDALHAGADAAEDFV